MTPNEFKAWFEGFSEAVDGAPTPAQWQRISEKVATLNTSLGALPGVAPMRIGGTAVTPPAGIYSTSHNACEVKQ